MWRLSVLYYFKIVESDLVFLPVLLYRSTRN
jgi:hypothetical protein